MAEIKNGIQELLMRTKLEPSNRRIEIPVPLPLISVDSIRDLETWILEPTNRVQLVLLFR